MHPLARSSDHAKNFGVELEDEKTWKIFPLYRGEPAPVIRGKVIQLLDQEGNTKYEIDKDFEFNIYCNQIYGADCNILETRFMYLPPELVRDYGIDDNIFVDIILHEIVYFYDNVPTLQSIYKPMIEGPKDITPKKEKNKTNLQSKTEDNSATELLTKIRILFLCVNPKDTTQLRVDEEIREIEQEISLAQKKNTFSILNKGAVRVSDIQRYLNLEQPKIVHFSSHGTNKGEIILEDENGISKPIPLKALERVFRTLKDEIQCVILNACFSYEQAKAISKHIDCVIGMSSSISDMAAINFSKAFYRAIASGRNLENAFEQGKNELILMGIPEVDVPQLLIRNNVDAEKIIFVDKKVMGKQNTETRKKIKKSRATLRHSKRLVLSRSDYQGLDAWSPDRLMENLIKHENDPEKLEISALMQHFESGYQNELWLPLMKYKQLHQKYNYPFVPVIRRFQGVRYGYDSFYLEPLKKIPEKDQEELLELKNKFLIKIEELIFAVQQGLPLKGWCKYCAKE